ncbi:MAG TPA: hypothetical protein VMU28_13845 [Terriglobales bacterium]|nr:hypothetical protein [Terriglobales bacterium]
MNSTDEHEPSSWWKTPRAISRLVGIVLFALLFWLQSPPLFLQSAGIAAHIFAIVLWTAVLLVYTVIAACVLVFFVFVGWNVYHLLRSARRWFRLQEIRSWRAKRACNARTADKLD